MSTGTIPEELRSLYRLAQNERKAHPEDDETILSVKSRHVVELIERIAMLEAEAKRQKRRNFLAPIDEDKVFRDATDVL